MNYPQNHSYVPNNDNRETASNKPEVKREYHWDTTPNVLSLIEEAISLEREKKEFYDYIISLAPAEEDRRILMSIREAEMEHIELFKRMYAELSGQVPGALRQWNHTRPRSYCEALKNGLFSLLEAVENHQEIMWALEDRRYTKLVNDIIIDELRDAHLFNFLFAKNACYREYGY